jgi:hypothetical protein
MLIDIEDKVGVLKHAGEWVDTNTTQPATMALAAGTKLPPQLEELLSKHINAQLNQFAEHHKYLKFNNNNNKGRCVHQEWMLIPPSTMGEM